MKKRGVSPVIATVLLIALVTAAAAIVFLVVIPMLQGSPEAIITITPGSTNTTTGDRAIQIKVEAKNGPLNITGVSVIGLTGVQILDLPEGSSLIGTVIAENEFDTLYIVGPFALGAVYDITLSFGELDKTFSHTA
ncbi:MAG: type IV pilin [Candidatus Heimdallarchaeota archaeon]|nr:type IV pilin [Candidatus Heimdallarchaeota archaeon]MCK4610812.1 type IV pilin [Candidatus Heimdallarchaeota archaeon]